MTTNKTSDNDRAPKNRPVHEIRMGRIRAAIWVNETESGMRHNVTVTKLFKDGENWRDTSSFGRDDLPLVVSVCNKAHSWIYEQATEQSQAQKDQAEVVEEDAAP